MYVAPYDQEHSLNFTYVSYITPAAGVARKQSSDYSLS